MTNTPLDLTSESMYHSCANLHIFSSILKHLSMKFRNSIKGEQRKIRSRERGRFFEANLFTLWGLRNEIFFVEESHEKTFLSLYLNQLNELICKQLV